MAERTSYSDDELMERINTIYIISKGRPGCTTARTLSHLGYPGKWYIVCGNNDDSLDEYKKRWGEHVIVFDWYSEIEHTDVLDNFGFESMASGAVPVRNATCDIARSRGELRHWQLDDDYQCFYYTDTKKHKNVPIKNGTQLQNMMFKISKFGYECKLNNVGFSLSTMEAVPDKVKTFGKRVFNAHNLPTDPVLFTRWRARMNDDLINAIETYRNGGMEMQFRFLQLHPAPTQSEAGGLTELYRREGTVRKSAYPILLAPNAARLVVKFGRYHHRVDWNLLCPKLISEKWVK